MEHESSSPYLQEPGTDTYPEPYESTPSSYFRLVLILSSYLHRYSSHIFPSSVQTKILQAFFFFSLRKYRIIKKERNIFPPKFQKSLECFPIN